MRTVRDINERGQVIGTSYPESDPLNGHQPVVWEDGTAVHLSAGETAAPVEPFDISERGHVVGRGTPSIPDCFDFPSTFITPCYPFSWSNGVWSWLVAPGSAPPGPGTPGGGIAQAVNDRDQVLGDRYAPDAPSGDETVVWQDGEVIVAPSEPDAVVVSQVGINERGEALVEVYQPDRGLHRGAIWRVGGGVTELGTLGGASSRGWAINDRGHVTGISETAAGEEHAFLWRDGEMVDLGTLGGASSRGRAINDRGHVTGTSETAAGEEHAFLWRDGEMVDLGTLGGGQSTIVSSRAINDRGQVVGFSRTPDGTHAFLWERGRMIDIGALVGSEFSVANAINDRGQIVGQVGGSVTDQRAVMWTASPHGG